MLVVESNLNPKSWTPNGPPYVSLAPTTTPYMMEAVSLMPLSCPQDWFTTDTVYRVNLTELPWRGTEPILLSASAEVQLGQVPLALQVVKGEGRR